MGSRGGLHQVDVAVEGNQIEVLARTGAQKCDILRFQQVKSEGPRGLQDRADKSSLADWYEHASPIGMKTGVVGSNLLPRPYLLEEASLT